MSRPPGSKNKNQICPQGHNKTLTGRTPDNGCRLCNNIWKKEWITSNPERVAELKRNHYLSNKDKYSKWSAQWLKEHPEKARQINLKRNLSRRSRIPKFGQDGIEEFYTRCPDGYEVDHIIPLQGKLVSGLHVIWNLQYLLKSENRRKSNKFYSGRVD